MEVQSLMRSGAIEYVWSGMLEAEVGDSPYPDRCEKIYPWGDLAPIYIEVDGDVELAAREYVDRGLKMADAIHVACAVAAACDWFLTVDRGILNKISEVGSMRVGTPIDYVMEAL